MDEIFNRLAESSEPSVRYLFRRDILGEDPSGADMISLQQDIRNSARVRAMLEQRGVDGRFPWDAYTKWVGAFWTLLMLTDIGYPAGDQGLAPLCDQVLVWLLSPKHLNKVPFIQGRWRRCALQEASIVYSMLRLGIVDVRLSLVVENLLKWQWPDGGWNCDKKPDAIHSSFHETWIPLLTMHVYAQASGDPRAVEAVQRASEVFLRHRLYKRMSDGAVMDEQFAKIAYPPFWHYDILAGLRVMDVVGKLTDPRCADALDLLESKRLPDGSFPAEIKYYRISAVKLETSGFSFVDWGGAARTRMNEWVTVHALAVLKNAGRLRL